MDIFTASAKLQRYQSKLNGIALAIANAPLRPAYFALQMLCQHKYWRTNRGVMMNPISRTCTTCRKHESIE